MSEIKAVIWDIGNVLVRWDPRFLYRSRFDSEEQMEHFLATVTTADWNLAQDEGRTFKEAVALLTAEYPEHADMIALYDTHWVETVGGTIDESVRLLEQLKANGMPVYGLTNFSACKWPIFCETYEFTKLFDDVVVSGFEKLIKPDPRIYELAIERFGIEPANTLFIDDRLENAQGAQAVGMKGHHFTDATILAEHLKATSLRL
ncbi:MAG: HAD family hydrolase [Kordiimonas sp.]